MVNAGVMALLGGLAAQAAKVLWEAVARRRWRPALFLHNGGMPSSHAATVTVLALAIGTASGFDSALFSLVLIFGLFVIFEATGLRQEVGKQAELLNELMETAIEGRQIRRVKLRELVGHTWAEVCGGIVFGALFWYLVYQI